MLVPTPIPTIGQAFKSLVGNAYSFQRDPNSKLLVALQAKDGKVLWQHSTQAANVILADGSLYASYSGHVGTSCYAARDSQLEKFQSDTGTRLWRFQLAA